MGFYLFGKTQVQFLFLTQSILGFSIKCKCITILNLIVIKKITLFYALVHILFSLSFNFFTLQVCSFVDVCFFISSPGTMSSPKSVIHGSLVLQGCTETYYVKEFNLCSSNDCLTYAIQFQISCSSHCQCFQTLR